jgi:hypothetical protein
VQTCKRANGQKKCSALTRIVTLTCTIANI